MNICISIGHGKSAKGGYDSGALGGNYQEFKIGREIGKYIGEIFKGYACTADVINYDATLYLTERIAHVNKHGYDLAIEIHLNAAGGTGSEVYYKHKSASGKKLAGAISKSIANTFGIRDRGAKVKINPANGTDYFGFVRSCKCESLLIETVFIDTASDRKHVESAAGQRQCAEAIVSAIANFYGIKKKSAPAVKPSEGKPTTVKAGNIVKIKGNRYATGQRIPMWVKLKKAHGQISQRRKGTAQGDKQLGLYRRPYCFAVVCKDRRCRQQGQNKARCDLRRTHGGTRLDSPQRSADKDSHRRQNTDKQQSP